MTHVHGDRTKEETSMSKSKRYRIVETNPSGTDELINVCENEHDTITEETSPEVVFGVVDKCEKLNIRKKPTIDSEVLCVVDANTELMIDIGESTEEWLKVCCADGIEGFCMKKYTSTKQ